MSRQGFFVQEVLVKAAPEVGAAEGLTPKAMEEIQAVFSRIVEDPAVREALLKKGWLSLEPGQAGAFGYQAAGGLIISDSAKVTDGNHAVMAEEDRVNELAERVLAWLKVGKDASEVVRNARFMKARRGNLLVLEAEPGLTVDQVQQLLVENGIEGAEAARAVMGSRVQVEALPVFAFQLFAGEDGLPPVIVLTVAVRLKDESGRDHPLILMA